MFQQHKVSEAHARSLAKSLSWRMNLNKALLDDSVALAKQAGARILEIYNKPDFDCQKKGDGSPLTEADQASHCCIVDGLKALTPEIPVLSEESDQSVDYHQRLLWDYYWLVDPLDGTKEFIKRNGEFTVNIALIHNHKPVLGVVYAPVLDTTYLAMQGMGAYCQVGNGDLKALPLFEGDDNTVRMVVSKSHCSPETHDFIAQIEKQGKNVQALSKGSSLKLCMVAEGEADIYPRLGPTMEWDTAAAQCVVEQSGKAVTQYESGEALQYNKQDLLNPWFVVQ